MARTRLRAAVDYSLPFACVAIGAFIASKVLGGFDPDTFIGRYFEAAALFVTGCGLLVDGIDAMVRAIRKQER